MNTESLLILDSFQLLLFTACNLSSYTCNVANKLQNTQNYSALWLYIVDMETESWCIGGCVVGVMGELATMILRLAFTHEYERIHFGKYLSRGKLLCQHITLINPLTPQFQSQQKRIVKAVTVLSCILSDFTPAQAACVMKLKRFLLRYYPPGDTLIKYFISLLHNPPVLYRHHSWVRADWSHQIKKCWPPRPQTWVRIDCLFACISHVLYAALTWTHWWRKSLATRWSETEGIKSRHSLPVCCSVCTSPSFALWPPSSVGCP